MSAYEPSTNDQVEQANAGGRQPVLFVRGLWLLPTSWAPWAEFFRDAGYAPVLVDWPDDPATVDAARAEPNVLAGKTIGAVVDHVAGHIGDLTRTPVVIGYSMGGLVAEMLAGRGLVATSVAISPAAYRGILPVQLSPIRALFPILANPLNRRRAVPLSFKQFRFIFANALSEDEARQLYSSVSVAGSAATLFQAAFANFNPRTEAKVNHTNPDRGPMLIISGDRDHIVPWAVANTAYKKQKRNPGVTEIVKIANRGHSLTIDGGWREVAEAALAFVKRCA